ncbi:unnamed protein product [Diamesa serratosioi]
MLTSLSPKFTQINFEEAIQSSRSGRPQKIRQLELNYIPTDVLQYVTKSNPKKKKPKIVNQRQTSPIMTKFPEQPMELIENTHPNLALNKISTEYPLDSEKKLKSTKRTLNNSNTKPRKSLRTLATAIIIDTSSGIETNVLATNNAENLVPDESHIYESEKPILNDSTSTKIPNSKKVTKTIFKTKKIKSILNISEQAPICESEKTSLIIQLIKEKKLTHRNIKLELIETSLNEESIGVLELESKVIKDEPMDSEEQSYKLSENNKSKDKLDFSDTDSAKGSSIADSSTPASKDFNAGQILWGSNSKKSYYPCMVYPNADGLIITTSNKCKMVHVKYFNWNGFVANISVNKVIEFNGLEEFLKLTKSLNGKRPNYTKSALRAIEEANFFNQYAISDRIKIFDDVLQTQFKAKSQGKNRKISSDSLLGSGSYRSQSPDLSSPEFKVYSPLKQNPVENYLNTMARYESITGVLVKKEILDIKPKLLNVKIEPDSTKILAVRRSVRQDKRKFAQVIKQEIMIENLVVVKSEVPVINSVEVSTDPNPKKYKPNIESLEERFLLNIQDPRYLFRSITKKRACSVCLVPTTKIPTYKCQNCKNFFHENCAASFELTEGEYPHQTGDVEEFTHEIPLQVVLICHDCSKQHSKCFICKQIVMEIANNNNDDHDHDNYQQQCPQNDCQLNYHKKCLKLWSQNNIDNMNGGRSQCPQHQCHTCFSLRLHKSGILAKCLLCPAAYHTEAKCVPAGSQILSQTQLICPRHPSKKITKAKNLNVDWCNICSEPGELVCCDSCPGSFHADCIKYEASDDKFICEECQDGRLPSYNTIVWARVGNYRWWPSLIMPDIMIPEVVLRLKKEPREFCVRFFGSNDYYWVTCEKVFLFGGTNDSTKSGTSRLDLAFKQSLTEANEIYDRLKVEDSLASLTKPKPYQRIFINRPVKVNKIIRNEAVDESSVCDCKSSDENPCGNDSSCINFILHIECNKSECPAGVKCQNQKLQNRSYVEMTLVKTTNRGFGAISSHDIEPNELVIEYVGELIDNNELKRRMDKKIENKETDFYFLTISADLYIDAEPAGNMARFINHSCEPNCDSRKVTVDGNTRIGIYSNQFIKAGSELTFDYQMQFVDNLKSKCCCGATKCSGFIGQKFKEERKLPEKKKNNGKKKRTIKIKPVTTEHL